VLELGLWVSGDGWGCGRSAGMTGPLDYGGVWVGYTVCYDFYVVVRAVGSFSFLSYESLSLVDLLFLISIVTPSIIGVLSGRMCRIL
jgi:hypothetical protein